MYSALKFKDAMAWAET